MNRIEIEYDGRKWGANYEMKGRGEHAVVTVHSDDGERRSTQLNDRTPAALAESMLREIAHAARLKGGRK